jgi:competence protein ComGC
MDRKLQKGQVLIEGLLLMLFLVSVLVVLMNFTKKQNEVFKKNELPTKLKYQNR